MLCVSVSRSLAKLGYCVLKQCFCDIVNTVVVVSVLREITCRLKIDYISVLVTYGLDVCVLDSRKRVCGNRESSYAECHKAVHIGIVKCHLDFLIRILIVHKMDYIHSIDIKPAKPFKVSLVSLNHLVVIEPVALNRVSLRSYFSQYTLSYPPFNARSKSFARLQRAPKNCICLPTCIAETQQAMA